MRTLRHCASASCCSVAAAACAAVTGTVINQTTGKPQAGATVGALQVRPGTAWSWSTRPRPTPRATSPSTRTAGKGRTCSARHSTASPTTTCCRRDRPTTGITIDVYNASQAAGRGEGLQAHDPVPARRRPDDGQRDYLFENDGKTTWNDPGQRHAALLPAGGREGKAEVNATAPDGMPIGAPVDKTVQAGCLRRGFPHQARRDALRPDLLRALHRRRGLRRQDRHQGREHLPDRAQRRHAGGRRPERPGRGAAHPGPHLRAHRRLLTRSS